MKGLSLTLLLLLPFLATAQWEQLDDFPHFPFDDGCVMATSDGAFIGTGLADNFIAQERFYTWSNSWMETSPLPLGNRRQYAAATANGLYGFIIGGVNDVKFYGDLLEFDSRFGTWTSLSELPTSGRSGSCAFYIEDEIYIVGGLLESGQRTSEIWKYNIASGSWVEEPRFPNGSVWRAAYTSHGNWGYMLFGKDSVDRYSTALSAFNPNEGWQPLSNYPGTGKTHAALVYFHGALYTFGGSDSTDTYSKELWKFDLQSSEWTLVDSSFHVGIRGGSMWIEDHYLHYVGGLDENLNRSKSHWRFDLTPQLQLDDAMALYPNPASEEINIESAARIEDVALYDAQGNELSVLGAIQTFTARIETNSLPHGMYILMVQTPNGDLRRRVIVTH